MRSQFSAHRILDSGQPARCIAAVRFGVSPMDAREALDLAELGEPAGIALVPGDPVEELRVMALGEVGAVADRILAGDGDAVVDRLDVVVDRRLGAAREEGRGRRSLVLRGWADGAGDAMVWRGSNRALRRLQPWTS
jgi:hypothetical protein